MPENLAGVSARSRSHRVLSARGFALNKDSGLNTKTRGEAFTQMMRYPISHCSGWLTIDILHAMSVTITLKKRLTLCETYLK
jgi:hypothetical protein